MSKHWDPRRPSRARTRRRTAFGSGEIRLAVLGGIFAGLAYVLLPWSEPGLNSPGQSGDPSDVRIIDGDTFHYRGDKIRIADIDTPEVNGRCAYESELAARATERMDELLHQGPFELVAIERDEDRYGRKLRVVTRGGHSLGDQLVSEGLARTWTGRREPWCA